MKRPRSCLLIATAIMLVTAGLAGRSHAAAGDTSDQSMNGKPIVLQGYVRDAACLFRNPAAGPPATDEALECTTVCVRSGGPLVVYTAAGEMYFVISTHLPDAAENARFLPYVGKILRIEGRMFERAGARAVAIEKFAVAPAAKSTRSQ